MKKIAIVGSINMDITCKTERFPKAGETIFGTDLQYVPGGKGNNQAVAAARLGGDVTMFACVGDDLFGAQLIENLQQNGVNTAYIKKEPDVATGIAIITVAEKDNTIVVVSGANNFVTPQYIASVKDALLEADIILMPNEIPVETIRYVSELAHSAGKIVVFNPAPFRESALQCVQHVSYLTPNEHEAALLFPGNPDLDSILSAQQGKLIVTLGSAGAAAWADGNTLLIPARKASVVDTTGAGDTFNGAFCFALANDYPLENALRFANVAASLSTEGYGAQGGMPTFQAVQEHGGIA